MSSLDGCYVILSVFLSKQKTAYERRISDWSSDVCSSDLPASRLSRYLATGPANEPAMFDTHLACAGKTQPRAIGLPSPKPPAGRSGAVSRGPTREPGVSEGTNRLAQALAFALTRLTLELTRPAATKVVSLR